MTSLVGTVSVTVMRLASEWKTCSAPVALGDDDLSNYIELVRPWIPVHKPDEISIAILCTIFKSLFPSFDSSAGTVSIVLSQLNQTNRNITFNNCCGHIACGIIWIQPRWDSYPFNECHWLVAQGLSRFRVRWWPVGGITHGIGFRAGRPCQPWDELGLRFHRPCRGWLT